MKLKNKKTGEIKDWDFGNWYQTILNPENKEKYECNLNDFIDRTVKFRKEWEDWEEPKEYYYLNEYLELDHEMWTDTEFDNKLKALGNYFETEEEAKKAVEKLKAWKRLKDTYHIRFALDFIKNNISFTYRIDDTSHSLLDEEHIVYEDMKTILGGEE